jgi:putative transposase
MNTALAQHQAIWRKADPRWHVQGIPSCFYTDHGSDFTSKHMEQVAADLKMQLIFSLPGRPRGRGKIERFFRTVNDTFLIAVPGFKNSKIENALTLACFTEMFHTWLVEQYLVQRHSELGCAPQERWEEGGFLPHQAECLEQLDLLLYTVAKARKVHQDGIHYQGLRYMEPTLAAFVGESVTIRYDPRDLAEIRVFFEDKFLCRAVCTKIESSAISLKEIVRARNQRRRELKAKISSRNEVVADYILAHTQEEPVAASVKATETVITKPKLKRYHNED